MRRLTGRDGTSVWKKVVRKSSRFRTSSMIMACIWGVRGRKYQYTQSRSYSQPVQQVSSMPFLKLRKDHIIQLTAQVMYRSSPDLGPAS